MPKALLVDLDDTLVDRRGAFGAWAAAFAGRHGRGEPDVEWLVELDEDGFRGRDSFFSLVREGWRIEAPVDRLVSEFYDAFLPHFRCEPEVAGALRRARDANWRIAIVTNGSPNQETKIRLTGIDELVDAWCISSLEGVRKPDPEILRRAAARAGASPAGGPERTWPERMWMVGDAPAADIGGAVAAGIRSAWVSRGRAWTETGYEPTLVAGSFPEAVDAILARSQGAS